MEERSGIGKHLRSCLCILCISSSSLLKPSMKHSSLLPILRRWYGGGYFSSKSTIRIPGGDKLSTYRFHLTTSFTKVEIVLVYFAKGPRVFFLLPLTGELNLGKSACCLFWWAGKPTWRIMATKLKFLKNSRN
ncbi:hypothetical protein K402DRAFT_121306 [Aulographum hederae CBS 113979]|uniref:Uncharacterized protein n=1 Tax=Aulographum hederae CBS 113979 TaxID=1176131 RepID=A0A6G1GVX5_9PEZI|nr:hypothetical protein K402DRAFT_121306 [Aulographum hederae CBS 113979]